MISAGCSPIDKKGKFIDFCSHSWTGLTCPIQSSDFKGSLIYLREADIQGICNLLEMHQLRKSNKTLPRMCEIQFFKCLQLCQMWVDFQRRSKKAYPCYKLQIPPLHRNLDVHREIVLSLLLSVNQPNIAKTFTESLPVPSKQ